MDRRLIEAGALPQDLDINQNMQGAMVNDGLLAEATMGSATWAYGLACGPTVPASLQVVVGRGVLGQMSVVDATNPGTSAIADPTDALMKLGVNLTGQTLAFNPPGGAGQSQCWLIEASLAETDGGATVLPFFNAANPSQPFSGPNNSGASTNTLRTQRALINVVAGAPATTGAQQVPAATAGCVPLCVVTLANGAAAITAANIAYAAGNPYFMPLPTLSAWIETVVVAAGTGLAGSGTLLTALETLFGGGRLLRTVVLTGAGTYTPGPGTGTVEVEGIAPGGAGGASSATDGAHGAAGGGGGAGAYVRAQFTAAALSGVPFSCGTPGASASTGDGNSATAATLGTNGSLVSLPGGLGGKAGIVTTSGTTGGGGQTAAPTVTGALNVIDAVPGQAGFPGDVDASTSAISGRGADGTMRGAGGAAADGNVTRVGSPGSGFGAGGSGAASNANNQNSAGGSGAPGRFVMREYS